MMELRPYQNDCIRCTIDGFDFFDKQLIVAPTGCGKTVIASGICKQFMDGGERVLFLAHREELLLQTLDKFKKANGIFGALEKAEDRASLMSDCVVGSVQSMTNQNRLNRWPKDHFGLVVVDECFPAGTMVDGVPIECLKIGDRVTTHLGYGFVRHVFKRTSRRLIELRFSCGKRVVSTLNHPFWTPGGFIPAKDLTADSMVLTITENEQMSNLQIGHTEKAVRQPKMQVGVFASDNSEFIQEAWRGDNQIQKNERNAQPCYSGSGFNPAESNGMEADSSRRKRNRADNPAASLSVSPGMGYGNCDCDEKAEREWLSVLLQGGCWELGPESGNRCGWKLSRSVIQEGAGRKERLTVAFSRLVSAKVFQSSDRSEFERVCPGGIVFNLEVSNGNTYFSNGILVHNCHHSVANSYQRILGHFDCHAKVAGITATPDRGDKKNLGQYFENIAFEISLFDLINQGYLSRISVKSIPLKIDLSAVRQTAGDYNETDLGNALTPYMRSIAKSIADDAAFRKVLVFLPLIATSQAFTEVCKSEGLDAKHIDGTSHDRKELLEWFEKTDCAVLNNAMLLTEGYDNPSVDCVIILRPTRSRSLYSQMVGRGTRVSPGKENLLLLDFLWMHEKHSLIRPAHLVAQTEEIAAAMTKATQEPSGGEQEELDLQGLESDVRRQREEKLKEELEAKIHRKARTVDAMEFCLSIHDTATAEYAPSMKWEFERPSDGQVEVLERNGIHVGSVKNKGHAAKIIDLIIMRERLKLSTPKQIRLMRQFGHPHPDTATLEQATAFIGKRLGNRGPNHGRGTFRPPSHLRKVEA